MTPEGKIVQDIRRWIRSIGGQVRKCSWEGRRGAPDLLIMINGHHHWLEVKSARGELTLLQRAEIGLMRQNGCSVDVVRSLDDAKAVLSEYLSK